MPPKPFFEQVYAVVRRIPPGQVTSYGRVAYMLGAPNAARAVGYAMSALKYRADDPRYNDVPWQRVINHEGRISIKNPRFSALRQAELLRQEGVEVSQELTIDLERYLWPGLDWPEIKEIVES